MAMNAVRQKKMIWVMATLLGAIVAVVLVLYAVRQKTDYYYDPTAISQGKAPQETRIRAGGMVVRGSVEKGDVVKTFKITDFKSTVPVTYEGPLPDLFAEGSGVVATGELQGNTFVAKEVLAKHDENYMPPEVAKSLKNQHQANGTNTNQAQFMPATPVNQ